MSAFSWNISNDHFYTARQYGRIHHRKRTKKKCKTNRPMARHDGMKLIRTVGETSRKSWKTLSSPIGKLTISRKLRPVDSAVHTLACPWSSTNHSTQSVQLLRFLCRFKPMIHRALFSLFKLLSYLTESPGHRVFSGNPPGNHFPFVFWRWIANGQCRRLGSLQRAAHRCRHGVQSLGETGISEL